MHIHYVQHVPFETLGSIQNWINANGHTVSATQVWEQAQFPSGNGFDLLIVLGGPMGAYDEPLHGWLAAEKAFILAAVKAGKKVLGICLGTQLLASVLGAAVYQNNHKEIGWFDVNFDPSFSHWLGQAAPGTLSVFHWHGDTFDIPDRGVNPAWSAACTHQLFTYGEHCIGIQFHPEMAPGDITRLVGNCRGELEPAPYIQPEETILTRHGSGAASFDLLTAILEKLLK